MRRIGNTVYDLPIVPPLPTDCQVRNLAYSERFIATLRQAVVDLATAKLVAVDAPNNLWGNNANAFWAEVTANLPPDLVVMVTGHSRDMGTTRYLMRRSDIPDFLEASKSYAK